MKVEKFKLIDNGYNGIELWGQDVKKKENGFAYIDAQLKFKVPMPRDLVDQVQKMKLFFLQLTGYWEARFAAYLDEHYKIKDENDDSPDYLRAVSIFENCEVTGLTSVDGGFIIMGKFKNAYEQTIGLSTPKATFEGSYTNYEVMNKVAVECITVIEEYVNDRTLKMMEPKQYALKLFEGQEEHNIEAIEKMTEQELLDIQQRDLEEKGYFVINKNDFEERKEEPKEEIFVESKDNDEDAAEDVPDDGKSIPSTETGTEVRKKNAKADAPDF